MGDPFWYIIGNEAGIGFGGGECKELWAGQHYTTITECDSETEFTTEIYNGYQSDCEGDMVFLYQDYNTSLRRSRATKVSFEPHFELSGD